MGVEPSIYWLTFGCEVAFWLVLGMALTARYVARRPTLGRVLLAALPALDVILLACTSIDLKAGTAATLAHGMTAVYIGSRWPSAVDSGAKLVADAGQAMQEITTGVTRVGDIISEISAAMTQQAAVSVR